MLRSIYQGLLWEVGVFFVMPRTKTKKGKREVWKVQEGDETVERAYDIELNKSLGSNPILCIAN